MDMQVSKYWHITDSRSQKAVSADPITDTDLFKAIFYHEELLLMILQSVFLDIYSVPELKMGGTPLLGENCEKGFFYLRGGGEYISKIYIYLT